MELRDLQEEASKIAYKLYLAKNPEFKAIKKKKKEKKKETSSGGFGFLSFFGGGKKEEPEPEKEIQETEQVEEPENPENVNIKDMTFTSIETLPLLFQYLKLKFSMI